MGGSTGWPQRKWSVVTCTEPESHQHSQTQGSVMCNQRVPESSTWQSGPLDVRQHHSSVVNQAGGWDQVIQVNPIDNQVVEVLQLETDYANLSTHSQMLQCASRQFVRARRGAHHGVVHRPRVTDTSVQMMGMAVDRPVCHIRQQEMSLIHLPVSGSLGGLHRLNVNPVVPDGIGVRFPTVQNDLSCISQVMSVSLTHDDTGNSIPAGRLMDAGTSPTGLRQTNTSHRPVSTSVSGCSSTRQRNREPDLPLLQPTRMETFKALFRKLGHPECAAQLMTSTIHHDWPSQMHENLLISRVKTQAIANVLMPLINKFECIFDGQAWWVCIT